MVRASWIAIWLGLGGLVCAQEGAPVLPLAQVAQALDRARASGAIARLEAERYYRLRRVWVDAGGEPSRPPTEALLRVRAFQGGDGYTVEVARWSPEELEPRWRACVLNAGDLVRWGERPVVGMEHRPGRDPGPRFLPAELVEWAMPLLWDQGLPAELVFQRQADTFAVDSSQALIRIEAPRPGEERATITVLDAETERTMTVASAGPEAGRLLGARTVPLYGAPTRSRWEEVCEPLSTEDFQAERESWRRALLDSHLELRLVHGQTGEPVGGVEVRLQWPGGELSDAVASASGRAVLPHPGEPGLYGVAVRGPGFHGFTCLGRSQRVSQPYVLLDGRRGFAFDLLSLDLDLAQLRAGLELRLWPLLEVRGVVLAPDGRPVSGASVRYGPAPGALRHLVESDREGAFRLQAAPGVLQLVASHPRWQATVWAGEVGPGSAPLRVVLGVGGELQGRVLDGQGRSLAGALVEALVPGAEHELGTFDPTLGGRRVQDASDAHGRYLLRGVPPGRVGVRVSRLGYRPLWLSDCVVEEGGLLEQRLQLVGGGGVGGRLLDAQGSPLSVSGAVVYGPVGASWSVAVALLNQRTFFVEEPRIGRYWLRVEAEGYRPRRVDDVPAGERDLELRLERE